MLGCPPDRLPFATALLSLSPGSAAVLGQRPQLYRPEPRDRVLRHDFDRLVQVRAPALASSSGLTSIDGSRQISSRYFMRSSSAAA